MADQTVAEKRITSTPGPWSVTIRHGQNGPIGYITADTGHIEVAVLYGDGHLEADARLIASAPDLLVALKKAVETIRVWHSIHATDDEAWAVYRRHAPEMQAINAAIAKAEGRS